jgi:hypothetical protein
MLVLQLVVQHPLQVRHLRPFLIKVVLLTDGRMDEGVTVALAAAAAARVLCSDQYW